MVSDKNLKSLARELKIPLTAIAREAELHQIDGISKKATEAMTLLDGYLLAAQTEYGQVGLPLETIGIGSVIYEVGQDIRGFASARQVQVMAHVNSHSPVMAHRRGLKIALECLAQVALSSEPEGDSPGNRLELVTYEKRNGKTAAGVVSDRTRLTPRDLVRAALLNGQSHMSLSLSSAGSGIRLAIASQLAESIGAQLTILSRNGLNGVGLELAKSEQLQLV